MTDAISGYEYGITCPNCGHYTDTAFHQNPNEGIECGEEDFPHDDTVGCGQTLTVTVNATETPDPYDDIPTEELAYHWFLQGFLASRDGFNAEDTFQHNHPDKDLPWRENTPTLTHDTRELLRELFEHEWNTPDEQTFEAMVNESTEHPTITDLYTEHTDL